MARPRKRVSQRMLESARKTLARMEALNPEIDPKWRSRMIDHWRGRVVHLERVVEAENARIYGTAYGPR